MKWYKTNKYKILSVDDRVFNMKKKVKEKKVKEKKEKDLKVKTK